MKNYGVEVTTTDAPQANVEQRVAQHYLSRPRWGKWFDPDENAGNGGTGAGASGTTDNKATDTVQSSGGSGAGGQTTAKDANNNSNGNNGNGAGNGAGAGGKTPLDTLPADVRVYIEELRDEAKKYRLEKQKAERDAKESEEARLASQNEWKVLAEKRAQRIAELEPIELQAKELQEAFNATLEAKLKDIPEDVRKAKVDPVRAMMTPVAFSQWLDAILPDLKARPAPNLDAGAGGSASKQRKLSPDDVKKVAY